MKRALVCGLVSAVFLGACSDGGNVASRSASANPNSVEAVLQQQMAAEEPTAEPEPTVDIMMENPPEAEVTDDFMADTYELCGEPDPSVDVDLTVMNSNMVYAEVYNMMMYPEDYIGKAIKIRGFYNVYEDEVNKQTYYSCIIQDATACCAQGIEFVPEDLQAFCENGYQQGDEVTVSGVFDVYPDGEYMYAVLTGAEIQ